MDKLAFMQACRKGAVPLEAALGQLYDDYRDALLRDGCASIGDVELARDLVQDTLIKAWLACATFRGESQLFPWLRRIFRRSLVDMLRSRPAEQPLPPGDGDGSASAELDEALRAWRGPVDATPEQALAVRQSEACYRACAERFRNEQPLAAAVIRWVVEDELNMAEVAELLQRSPGASREFVSQCRKKARVYFADWYALAAHGLMRSEA